MAMYEVAKASITLVPTIQGAQSTITEQLTGVTKTASEKAGSEGGSTFGEKFGKALKTTSAVIAGALTAATGAVIATGKAFIDGANSVAQYGDNVDKMSQKMGISAKAYQEWDFVMQHAGASIEGLKSSMKILATQAETNADAFSALGISQEQVASMSQEELFSATISGLQQMEDEMQRTYLAGKLLGRGVTELGALLNMSAEETDSLKQQVNDLGVMSDEAVKDAAAYQDAMTNMQTSMTGLKNNMMSQMLPGITLVMDGLAKVFAGDGDGVAMISDGLNQVISTISKLAPTFFTLAQTLVMNLLEGFGPMLPSVVSVLFDFINMALSTITTMIPQLTPIITQGLQGIANALGTLIPVLIPALFGVVQGLLQWLADGNQVKLFLDGIIAMVSELTEQFALILPVLLPAVINILGQVIDALTSPDNLMMVINATLVMVGAIVMALVEALPEIGGVFVKLFTNIIGQLKIFGIDIFGSINKFFNEFWPKEKEFFGNLIKSIKEKCTEIWNNARDWFTSLPAKITSSFTNIVKVFTDFGTQAKDWGMNIITGLWGGINDKISWIKEKIKGMGAKITEAIKGVFGIHSPSRVMRDEVGKFLAEGIGVGFTDEMDNVADTMASNANLSITSQVTSNAASAAVMPGGGFGGSVTINVNAAPGQSAREIAREAAIEFQNMLNIKGAVYA